MAYKMKGYSYPGKSPLKQDYVKDIYHEKFNPSGKIGKPEKMGTIRDVSKEITRVAKGGKPKVDLIGKTTQKIHESEKAIGKAKEGIQKGVKKIKSKIVKIKTSDIVKQMKKTGSKLKLSDVKKSLSKSIKAGGKVAKFLPGVGTVITAAQMMTAKSATATQPGTGKHGGKKTGKYNPKTGKYE